MALPVKVFHFFFDQDMQGHTHADKALCRECYAKGAVDVGIQYADRCSHCTQIVVFSMLETDIAIESVFNSFANRMADPRNLGEWLRNVLK